MECYNGAFVIREHQSLYGSAGGLQRKVRKNHETFEVIPYRQCKYGFHASKFCYKIENTSI